jgi:hypothetical protein
MDTDELAKLRTVASRATWDAVADGDIDDLANIAVALLQSASADTLRAVFAAELESADEDE